MARKIKDLQDHLFDTLEKLKSGDKDMSIEKAKAIANVSQTILNSAKLEIDYIRATEKLDGIYEPPGILKDSGPKRIDPKK